jgi:hypothetical protein
MLNYNTLASYLSFRFSGTLNPVNNIVTSGDIIGLTAEEKSALSKVFNNNCFVNVNEPTTPQVLTRVFECLYEKNLAMLNTTDIKITNLPQLLKTVQVIAPLPTPQLTPSYTPSVSPTPSITPTISHTVTPSATPVRTPSVTPCPTPSITPSPTVTPSLLNCDAYQFYANNGEAGAATYTPCGGSSTTTNLFNGEQVCVANGSTPSSSDGYFISLGYGCA